MTRDEQAQRFVGLVDGRWTLPVLSELSARAMRYQELHDAVHGVSNKVLTETLRRAERDGLVRRVIDPSRVETATVYQLTELGRSLDGLLTAAEHWVRHYWDQVEASRQRWSQRHG
jgi:DNA-binding HxlR family transcriptional regulator